MSHDEIVTPGAASPSTSPVLLNLGCDAYFQPNWENFDAVPATLSVIHHPRESPMPFADECRSTGHPHPSVSPGEVMAVKPSRRG